MKNIKIVQLERAYTKNVKNINKDFFVNKEAGLLLFVEHLRYLRDCFILKNEDTEVNKTKTAIITAVIAEFESYKNELEKPKKTFHWNNFCELVKLNMEEWL